MATTPPARRDVAAPEEAASRFQRLPASSYDVVVIGAGSGGLSAAGMARAFDARVALIERDRFGGECLYTGCVASKALLHVARLAAQIRQAGELGLSAQLAPVDLGAVADHVRRVIEEVYVDSDAPENYAEMGVDIAIGAARFESPSTISVNGQTITTKHALVCTGSHPVVPAIPGLAEAGFLTNETIFTVRRLPPRLLVIGGGPIGCELGQAFARLGAQVTMLQRPDRIIPKDEPEASAVLAERLTREGVTILTGAEATRVTVRGGEKVVEVRAPQGAGEIVVDEILVAIGRAPTLEGLSLEVAKIAYDTRKGITVDANMRTNNPRVYAAGDVTGGYLFTHAAARQARAAIRNMLFPSQSKVDERVTPWATFTEPEVAHVGLTEAEARRQFGAEAQVYTQAMTGVDRAVTEGETAGFTKLICDKKGAILGAEIVGPSAGEFINEVALAMRQEITMRQLADTTHAYPTVALSLQQAAGAFSLERATTSGVVKLLRKFGG